MLIHATLASHMATRGIPTGASFRTPPHYSPFPGAVINTRVKFGFHTTRRSRGRRRAEREWKTEAEEARRPLLASGSGETRLSWSRRGPGTPGSAGSQVPGSVAHVALALCTQADPGHSSGMWH